MVLNLIRQVAGHERHHPSGVDVGAAQHLAQIPLALGFAFHVGLGEFLCAVGKWPQKITALAHTLRITLATALAVAVDL